MSVFKINNLDILSFTSAYDINRQNIMEEYQMENGNTKFYEKRLGAYTIDVKIVCKGDTLSSIETVLFSTGEKNVEFTYADTTHTANMLVKRLKSSCITLCDEEYWTLTFSLIESSR